MKSSRRSRSIRTPKTEGDMEEELSQRHAQIHFMNYNRNPIDCAGTESLAESTGSSNAGMANNLAGQVLW